jgi:organic radical activating enzyme
VAVHPGRRLDSLTAEVQQAATAGAAFVVITGGEPLEHPLDPLCTTLAAAGLPLHLETSGVGPWSGQFHWITLSPKPHRPPSAEALRRCQELKVVVHDAQDLAFAEAMASAALAQRRSGEPGPALLLQPGWDCPEGQRLAIGFVQAHPGWRLSLQSHKWLGVR